MEVASGVAEQPMTEGETIQGAKNRASAALSEGGDFGVGLEGGVLELDGKLFECAWAVVVKQSGPPAYKTTAGEGGGLYFELPGEIAKRIQSGEELGPIMAELLRHDVKRNEGAIGVFTKGLLGRQEAYEHLVAQALVRFVSPEWYH